MRRKQIISIATFVVLLSISIDFYTIFRRIEVPHYDEKIDEETADTYISKDGRTIWVNSYEFTYFFKSKSNLNDEFDAINNPYTAWRPYLSYIWSDVNEEKLSVNLIVCFGHYNAHVQNTEREVLLLKKFNDDGDTLCKKIPLEGKRMTVRSKNDADNEGMTWLSFGDPRSGALIVRTPNTQAGIVKKEIAASLQEMTEPVTTPLIQLLTILLCGFSNSCNLGPGG